MKKFLKQYKNNFLGFILVVLGLGLFIGVFIYLIPTRRNDVDKTLYDTLNTSISYTFLIVSGISVVIYGFMVMTKDEDALKFKEDLAEACTIKLPKMKFKKGKNMSMEDVDEQLQQIADGKKDSKWGF